MRGIVLGALFLDPFHPIVDGQNGAVARTEHVECLTGETQDGSILKVDILDVSGTTVCTVFNRYWSEQTIANAAIKAGFTHVLWDKPEPSRDSPLIILWGIVR